MNDQSEDGYPLVEIDEIGDEKAIWDFCGKFPLAEITKGRRACRAGWRNRTTQFWHRPNQLGAYAMHAVSLESDGDLLLECEYADSFEFGSPFCCAADMLAEDWYLERLNSVEDN